tara:strand:+ start:656 stop:1297 length:642 start_codon:yes stop_codon:yes gene_type:complete
MENYKVLPIFDFTTECICHDKKKYKKLPKKTKTYLQEIFLNEKTIQKEIIFKISEDECQMKMIQELFTFKKDDFSSYQIKFPKSLSFQIRYLKMILDWISEYHHINDDDKKEYTKIKKIAQKAIYNQYQFILKNPNKRQFEEINSFPKENLYFENVFDIPKEYPIHLFAECYLLNEEGLLERLSFLQSYGIGGNSKIKKKDKMNYRKIHSKLE